MEASQSSAEILTVRQQLTFSKRRTSLLDVYLRRRVVFNYNVRHVSIIVMSFFGRRLSDRSVYNEYAPSELLIEAALLADVT